MENPLEFSVGVLVAMTIAYFMPVTIAVVRKHPKTPFIFLVTVIFGWTVIGWVYGMFWALMPPRRRRYSSYMDDEDI